MIIEYDEETDEEVAAQDVGCLVTLCPLIGVKVTQSTSTFQASTHH